MTRCDRFEREGLPRLEQGLPLEDHFETCPDCRAARAAYERLRGAVATAGDHYTPPSHWQERVWERIEARRPARPSRSWRWLLAPAGVAAAAALLFAVVLSQGPAPPSLEVQVEAGGGGVRRGGEVHPGDRILLRATVGDALHAELRVYRHDTELVLRCSSSPPCRRQGDRLRATLELEALGAYQSLLLLSQEPLPEPASDLDSDARAALAAGAQVVLGPEIRVQ